MEKQSLEHQCSPDDLLKVIYETMRLISERILEILAAEEGKAVDCPVILILDVPSELAGLKLAVKRSQDPDFFCNQARVRKELGNAYLGLWMQRQNHYLAEIGGSGRRCVGMAAEIGVAFYDRLVMSLVDDFSQINREKFLSALSEEVLHFYQWQTKDPNHLLAVTELVKALKETNDVFRKTGIDQEIEAKYGIKKKSEELVEAIKNDQGLFASIFNVLKKTLL
ncbi:MAG: hypothetical protein AAB465_03235 [Patescibacteria group bacterium]